jgi:hypothetical protein
MEDPKKAWPPRFPPARPGTEARTLTDIEKDDWGRPHYDSHLVQTCHALRHKPVGTFAIEDLRIMIGQGISLEVLIPQALEVLKQDPFAEGDYFPGDLLNNVLQVDASSWRAHPAQRLSARDVARQAVSAFDERAGTDEVVADAGGIIQVARRFLEA